MREVGNKAMQKNLSEGEKISLESFKIHQYMVDMTDSVRKFFPENTDEARVWCPQYFEGFEISIPKAEGLIDAVLNVCFWQQSFTGKAFNTPPLYKLDHVKFSSVWNEITQVDACYSYCGNWSYSGWVTATQIVPEKVIPLCVEIFNLFTDLTISVG
jgi:hypothetical protein